MVLNDETWLPAAGAESTHEVSSLGRVRSVGYMAASRWGPASRPVKPRMLNPAVASTGYLQVWLPGGRKYVHHLVLETFVGPRPDGWCACHRDDVKTNNCLENLYWGSYTQNWSDKARHGNDHQLAKTHCPRGHAYVPPNLVPSAAAKGRRQCLACTRAKNRSRHRSNETEEQWMAHADALYAELVA